MIKYNIYIMIHIITSFYISKQNSSMNEARNIELFTALKHNMENIHIEKIHLFLDDVDAFNKIETLSIYETYSKINIIGIKPRPKHIDYFKYAINNLQNEICMVINSDIYLYEIDYKLLSRIKTDKIAYAISTYEYDFSCPKITPYNGSHDGYIFNPTHIQYSLELIDFYPNTPGIETHIIKMLVDNGYKVFNPCYQIKIVHLHKSELRNYAQGWIGLHNCEDSFINSAWYITPVKLTII